MLKNVRLFIWLAILQVIDDPCGNSFLESITVPNMDPQLAVDHYKRTLQQDIQCGVVPVSVVAILSCTAAMQANFLISLTSCICNITVM